MSEGRTGCFFNQGVVNPNMTGDAVGLGGTARRAFKCSLERKGRGSVALEELCMPYQGAVVERLISSLASTTTLVLLILLTP